MAATEYLVTCSFWITAEDEESAAAAAWTIIEYAAENDEIITATVDRVYPR